MTTEKVNEALDKAHGQSKFKVGQRVAVYGHKSLRPWQTQRIVGEICEFHRDHPECFLVKLSRESAVGYWCHPKQCRRLVKKHRRRLWVRPNSWSQLGTYGFLSTDINHDRVVHHFAGGYEYTLEPTEIARIANAKRDTELERLRKELGRWKSWQATEAIAAERDRAEAELAAYKKAKAENDERFQLEAAALRTELAALKAEIESAPVVYGPARYCGTPSIWTDDIDEDDSHRARLIRIEELK